MLINPLFEDAVDDFHIFLRSKNTHWLQLHYQNPQSELYKSLLLNCYHKSIVIQAEFRKKILSETKIKDTLAFDSTSNILQLDPSFQEINNSQKQNHLIKDNKRQCFVDKNEEFKYERFEKNMEQKGLLIKELKKEEDDNNHHTKYLSKKINKDEDETSLINYSNEASFVSQFQVEQTFKLSKISEISSDDGTIFFNSLGKYIKNLLSTEKIEMIKDISKNYDIIKKDKKFNFGKRRPMLRTAQEILDKVEVLKNNKSAEKQINQTAVHLGSEVYGVFSKYKLPEIQIIITTYDKQEYFHISNRRKLFNFLLEITEAVEKSNQDI